MKKKLRYLFTLIALFISVCFISQTSYGQPWFYNFGTGTGNFDTANKSSTTFINMYGGPTPDGGGTFRLRTSPIGTSGAGEILANPGTSLGSGTELQLNAANSAAINKLTVYGWSNPTPQAYVKYKFRSTSTDTGVIAFTMGDGVSLLYTGNDTYTAYASTMAAFTIAYKSGVLTTVSRRNATATTPISTSGLMKDADQTIEVFANNASTATTYTKNGTNNLGSQTWDLWVDGIKISPDGGWTRAQATNMSFIAADVPLAGFGIYANLSHTNEAFAYIDDMLYSNSLSNVPLPLTLLLFNAALKGNSALLAWETTNEINVYGYSIEKNVSGNMYEQIGSVAALNQQNNQYNFTDAHVKAGSNLYRIKMIDKDGQFKYSSVVKLSAMQKSLAIHPNPVSGTAVTVNHNKAGNTASLKIISADGRIMKSIKVAEGAVQTTLNAASLLPGNYILIFENNDVKTSIPFTKQ